MTVYQKSDKVKRPYRSPRRQAQAKATRTAIAEAAGRLFVEHGYAATSMKDIADAAGVAEPTVYAALGDKPSIGKAAAEVAMATVESGVLADFEEAMDQEPDLGERARMAARTSHEAFGSDVIKLRDALVVGAASDARLSEVVEELTGSGRELTAWQVDLVIGSDAVSEAVRDRAVDVVWALSSSTVYRRLVETCGWSTDDYEDWLATEIERATRSTTSG